MQLVRDAWSSLSKRGRAVVLVVAMIAVAVLLWFAMAWGYDLSWLPGLLGAE